MSLFAGRLTSASPEGFGRGDFLLLLAGSTLLFLGIVGKKFGTYYRTFAILLLNTVVLALALELAAIILARSGLLSFQIRDLARRYEAVTYYADKSWADSFWSESRQAEWYRYEPYTDWRHRPFEGHTINVDDRGIRATPGSECNGQALKLFAFGGSTMWGWGAPDWETIAAHLRWGLSSRISGPVCVVNLGEDAYVSTQSLIVLLRQLQSGNVPDVVLFYDGVNDVYAAHRSGEAGVQTAAAELAARYEEAEGATVRWLKSSRVYWFVDQLMAKKDSSTRQGASASSGLLSEPLGISRLASAVVHTYLANYKSVEGLAREYGFEFFFFWQPQLGSGRKTLTPAEARLLAASDSGHTQLAATTHQILLSEADRYPNLSDLSDIFDSIASQIWIDEWGHITPEGNRLVAETMLSVLEDREIVTAAVGDES